MRYRLHTDAVIEAGDISDALRRVGEHFIAWSADTPSDDQDAWVAESSLSAPQFLRGSIHLIPEGEPDSD